MQTRYFYIKTIGCQMNVHDSDRIAGMMRTLGYEPILDIEKADLIFFNTCSVRGKAEQKTYSFLGSLAELKERNPGLIIGALGCVAQQEGEKLQKKMPHLDLVLGTHGYHRIPELLEQIQMKRCRISDTLWCESIDSLENLCSQEKVDQAGSGSRFVTIMRGCDNFCSYCVVPHVRGPEQSRGSGKIIEEIERAVKAGVREVTLLGQNVNSYGRKEGIESFPTLLEQVNRIKGLHRIRFTTSHPKDLSEELIRAFSRMDKLCRHIHLPVQSGSDRILKRMNRKYTREHYISKIDSLRQVCPEIAVTTDIIVGFPGETEEDFKQTLTLLEQVQFDALFAFEYSDRPNTRASGYRNKISEIEKRKRLQALMDIQQQYTLKKNRSLVGKQETILVDGISKKDKRKISDELNEKFQWTGRTSTNKVVNFIAENSLFFKDRLFPGALVCVTIEKAHANSLYGKAII
ncbi:MAG: tRNA (N6-isopentenyl adenosine(37)-C2)-methylthiotransferase MiaB [Thermodesulfobacteriota bacterium]